MEVKDKIDQSLNQKCITCPVIWVAAISTLIFLAMLLLLANTKQQADNSFKNPQQNNIQPKITKTQQPLPTYKPPNTPTIASTKTIPQVGKSYGVFYPYSQEITINNIFPSINGKISQQNNIYLPTKFGIEKSLVSGKDEYFLRFYPGRVNDFKLKIDGVEIKDVFGIPQYPTVLCKNINSYNGVSYIDKKTGKKDPPDEIFTTKDQCITHKRKVIPPLIFFAKTQTALAKGQHYLTLEDNQYFQTMIFFVDPDYHIYSENIFAIDKTSKYYFQNQYHLLTEDNCPEGYYHDSNYLKMPLPSFDNPDLFYTPSFPQSKTDLSNSNKYRVQIVFENKQFDLFFPQYSIFYKDELNNNNNRLDPFSQLFLPKDRLVFTNGSQAKYIDPYVIIPHEISYLNGYFEILPVDIAGGYYNDFSIPWVIYGSSGCDG